MFNVIYIVIDFSENLTESLHWAKEQVSVHSGILKCNGEKSYHPYFSDSRTHDQAFVKNADTDESDYIVIESDVPVSINHLSTYQISRSYVIPTTNRS